MLHRMQRIRSLRHILYYFLFFYNLLIITNLKGGRRTNRRADSSASVIGPNPSEDHGSNRLPTTDKYIFHYFMKYFIFDFYKYHVEENQERIR